MSASILAIETCSETCSVALHHQGKQSQLLTDEPRGHAKNILPLIDQLLAEHNTSLKALDAIAFTRGPGAFTGVRIGTSVAQGLSLAAELPLLAISSLAVLAQTSYRETGRSHCIAALDARMSEVYLGFYKIDEDNCMQSLQEEQVASPDVTVCSDEQAYLAEKSQWQGYGPGWTNYEAAMSERFKSWNMTQPESLFYPQAIDLLVLAEKQFKQGLLLDPADAMPVYVRDNVVRN